MQLELMEQTASGVTPMSLADPPEFLADLLAELARPV